MALPDINKLKQEIDAEDKLQYAIVVCYYKDKCYISLPMLLEDNSELTTTIHRIAREGTDNLKAWKMPITEFSFIIFSRTQLNETLFEVGFYTDADLRTMMDVDDFGYDTEPKLESKPEVKKVPKGKRASKI